MSIYYLNEPLINVMPSRTMNIIINIKRRINKTLKNQCHHCDIENVHINNAVNLMDFINVKSRMEDCDKLIWLGVQLFTLCGDIIT